MFFYFNKTVPSNSCTKQDKTFLYAKHMTRMDTVGTHWVYS